MPGMVQSFHWLNPSKTNASDALSSQEKGGSPSVGRPFGTCMVRAVNASPLCRCSLKFCEHSMLWITATTYQGTPSGSPTSVYRGLLLTSPPVSFSTCEIGRAHV